MRTPLATIVIARTILSLTQADTVVIRDAETGKTVAELNIDAKGPKFIHAGRTLTIERKAPLMELRARKNLLPRGQFRDASLDEVGDWLGRPSPYSDEPAGSSHPIINFVIIDQAKRNLRVSIYREQLSLHDLLASLARKYGLIIAYDDHAITVTDPKQSA